MYHVTSSRSKRVRHAMIPAALLWMMVAGCAELESVTPDGGSAVEGTPRIATTASPAFRKYFVAWSRIRASDPIQTQVFGLDAAQERQYVDWYPDETVYAFARANPGRLYIAGDEPDQWCIAPYEYAGMYQNFVTKVRGADPTAKVSPAGFAEPNARCCPEPATEPCLSEMHSVSYAQKFYDAYIQRYGSPPPVDEWRFHDFGIAYASGDIDGWWARIDKAASWSVAHGAKMVLGGWGFHGWREPVPVFQEYMKRSMSRLMHDPRITGAVYWAYEYWVETPRPLINEAGALTSEGQTYANPLTDVPAGVTIVESPAGQAQLRWSNTTSAWPTEVEFWVQTPGLSSFNHSRTERVTSHGATQSPQIVLYKGDNVRARVRYYNVFGEAEWSPFSNTVAIEGGKKRSPLPCFDSKRIQSQPCG